MRHPGLHWKYHDSAAGTGWLYLNDECIAVVGQRLDGIWHCTISRHREPVHWRSAICRQRATAQKWAERWADANAEALATATEKAPAGLAPVTPNRV